MKKRLRRLNIILGRVSKFYSMNKKNVTQRRNGAQIVQVRRVYLYIAYELGYTQAESAFLLGQGRSASCKSITAMKDIINPEEEYLYDKNTKEDVEYLMAKCRRFRKIRRK